MKPFAIGLIDSDSLARLAKAITFAAVFTGEKIKTNQTDRGQHRYRRVEKTPPTKINQSSPFHPPLPVAVSLFQPPPLKLLP